MSLPDLTTVTMDTTPVVSPSSETAVQASLSAPVAAATTSMLASVTHNELLQNLRQNQQARAAQQRTTPVMPPTRQAPPPPFGHTQVVPLHPQPTLVKAPLTPMMQQQMLLVQQQQQKRMQAAAAGLAMARPPLPPTSSATTHAVAGASSTVSRQPSAPSKPLPPRTQPMTPFQIQQVNKSVAWDEEARRNMLSAVTDVAFQRQRQLSELHLTQKRSAMEMAKQLTDKEEVFRQEFGKLSSEAAREKQAVAAATAAAASSSSSASTESGSTPTTQAPAPVPDTTRLLELYQTAYKLQAEYEFDSAKERFKMDLLIHGQEKELVLRLCDPSVRSELQTRYAKLHTIIQNKHLNQKALIEKEYANRLAQHSLGLAGPEAVQELKDHTRRYDLEKKALVDEARNLAAQKEKLNTECSSLYGYDYLAEEMRNAFKSKGLEASPGVYIQMETLIRMVTRRLVQPLVDLALHRLDNESDLPSKTPHEQWLEDIVNESESVQLGIAVSAPVAPVAAPVAAPTAPSAADDTQLSLAAPVKSMLPPSTFSSGLIGARKSVDAAIAAIESDKTVFGSLSTDTLASLKLHRNRSQKRKEMADHAEQPDAKPRRVVQVEDVNALLHAHPVFKTLDIEESMDDEVAPAKPIPVVRPIADKTLSKLSFFNGGSLKL